MEFVFRFFFFFFLFGKSGDIFEQKCSTLIHQLWDSVRFSKSLLPASKIPRRRNLPFPDSIIISEKEQTWSDMDDLSCYITSRYFPQDLQFSM